MMLERQREGIAKAKSEGRYKPRKPLKKGGFHPRPHHRPFRLGRDLGFLTHFS
jgi:DNA invertase Pin-like site-specific DNA recombinase